MWAKYGSRLLSWMLVGGFLCAGPVLGQVDVPEEVGRQEGIAADQIRTQPPIVPDAIPAPGVPSVEELKAKIESLENDTQLASETRDKVLELYRLALDYLETAAQSEAQAAAFEGALRSAPAATARIRKELELGIAAGEPPPSTIPAAATRTQLERRRDQAQAELKSLEKADADLADQIKGQQGRPGMIQEAIAQAKRGIDDIQWQLAAAAPPDQDPPIVEAGRLALVAQQRALSAEINLLEQELLSYDARLELLVARFNRAQLQLSSARDQVTQLEADVNTLLASEAVAAQQAAEQQLRETVGQNPVLQEAAAQNAALSQRLAALAEQIGALPAQRETVAEQLTEFKRDLRSIEQQLGIAGHTPVLAKVLIAERRKLPNLTLLERNARERRNRIADARLQAFQLNEQRQRLAAGEKAPDPLTADDVGAALSPGERRELGARLRVLVTERKALLAQLADSYASYAEQLTTLNLDEQQLIDVVRQLQTVLNERLLWAASTTPVGIAWFAQSRRATAWMSSLDNWTQAGRDLLGELRKAPVLAAGTLLVFVALIGIRARLGRRAETISGLVGKPYRDGFGLTLEMLLIVLLRILPWPLLLASTGRLLSGTLEVGPFSAGVGHGLMGMAMTVLLVEFFREVSRKNGLAQVHFQWSEQACAVLHRNFGWIRFISYPSRFMFGMLELLPADLISDAPGRILLMLALLAWAVFFWRVLHPFSGALGVYLGARRQGWLWRLRHLWYPLIATQAFALLVLVLFGYYYSAFQLGFRVAYSFYASMSACVVFHLLLRWARIAGQRLALARASAEREAARVARIAKASGEASGEAVPEKLELSEINLAEIGAQTRTLLGAFVLVMLAIVLWLLWSELVPAVGVLDRVTLWHNAVTVQGVESLEPVTLGELLQALAVLVLTLIAVHNLSGFLEISVLRRLSLNRGSQYAITTVSRYVIIVAGVVAISEIIGFGWSKVQWLVAALTVGLGFGLQEIFANFVSGLILLFERPIRIGDTVTVGTTSGTVTRIQTRATTITDWDHKELIIPNKSFVTGDVINWTLSNPVTRLIIRVGVAYGSDVDLTEKLLRQLAERNPMVLDDPPPTVFFVEFADSSLLFELRVFHRDILQLMPLTHELHKAINKTFAQNGIEIAFPQRDIHVRSVTAGAEFQPVVPEMKPRAGRSGGKT